MIKLFCCAATTILLSLPLSAQILNVEGSRLKGDSSNYFLGNIRLDFSLNNRSINDVGETVTFTGLSTNSDVGYISEKHLYLFLSELEYNAVTGEPINSTGYGHFRINFLNRQTLSYEVFTQLQYDQGRGMDFRWIGGGGIRYRFYATEKSSLYAGIGAMYEREVWQFPATEDRIISINIWKSTNYLASRIKLSENADFNLIAYYQTGYDVEQEFFRHRVSSDINLMIKISSHLAFVANVNGTYENRPVVPVSKLVYAVTNGVQFSF